MPGYCLKFKNKFRNWLWIKVREPKIQINYSPEKLLNLLSTIQNETDEYEFNNLLNKLKKRIIINITI